MGKRVFISYCHKQGEWVQERMLLKRNLLVQETADGDWELRVPHAPLAAGADVRENWRGLGQVAGNKMDPVVAYGEASGRRKPAGSLHARHLREEFAISPSVKSADGRKSGRRDNAPMG